MMSCIVFSPLCFKRVYIGLVLFICLLISSVSQFLLDMLQKRFSQKDQSSRRHHTPQILLSLFALSSQLGQ